MFIITHALAPVVAAQAIGLVVQLSGGANPLRKRDFLALMVAGMLPDLLSPHLSLDDRWSSHTHTIYFALACLPVAVWCARRMHPDHPALLAVLLWSAVLLHLAGDAISGGIACLYPWKPDILGGRFISFNSWFAWDTWMIAATSGLALIRWMTQRRSGSCPIGASTKQSSHKHGIGTKAS